jgi:hypothetical protein
MTSISDLFRQLQGKLSSTLFAPVTHPTTKGDTSETYWSDVLREFLPSRYRVGTGFAVDHTGVVSEQNDILIYDEQYSPLLWTNGNAVCVPIESVYAALEVKQELNLDTFSAAVKKANAVRSLISTSATITHLTGAQDTKKPFTPIAGLLTQRCGWSPPFGDPFIGAMAEAGADGQLDIGCTLEGGAWVIPNTSTGADWSSTEVVPAEHALLFLTTQLYNLLQALGTVPRIDIPTWLSAGGITPDRLVE